MSVLNYKRVYFLGIGGIGMSALARYFHHYGIQVAGYDKTSTPLTRELETEGIAVHYSDDATLIANFLEDEKKEQVLVVYTPAIPSDLQEYQYVLGKGYELKKRAEVLGLITQSFTTIAVAGTHGKTTTSSLIAHILKTANINTYAFLGGITKNYHTNLLLGNEEQKNAVVVVEADEYDRSFLTLHPDIAVITSVDADHLDIYGDVSYMHESYTLFAQQVKPAGTLIVKKNVDKTLSLHSKRLTYDVTLKSDYSIENVGIANGTFQYDVLGPSLHLKSLQIGLPGLHNVENSIAAIAVAQLMGVSHEHIREAIRSFQGVKRRFDYQVKNERMVYIDDYAHHPEELKAAISAARSLFPGKKITGIFQPHLFSRTRDFADGFAESLSLVDELILLEIYPAREKPITGINAALLLNKASVKDKKLLTKQEVIRHIEQNKAEVEVLMTLGAGDIDELVEPLRKILSNS